MTRAEPFGQVAPGDCAKHGTGNLHKLGVLDLFSGIGGFSLGLERTGGFGTVNIPTNIRMEHGLSDELVMSRIGSLGNAVVPQIPELIGNAILASLKGAP